MGAFSTVLLAILLIFAAGLIKLVIALMRKNPAAAKESPVHARASRTLSCLSLLRRESKTSAASCRVGFSYYAANRHKRKISCTVR